ncbi:hypothetical protein DFJ77DRAFT_477721 [Powellomyces hirtus]|nr:hypothetical protein DFJ77DRAFT_477721 [Powellomyces hirtus]
MTMSDNTSPSVTFVGVTVGIEVFTLLYHTFNVISAIRAVVAPPSVPDIQSPTPSRTTQTSSTTQSGQKASWLDRALMLLMVLLWVYAVSCVALTALAAWDGHIAYHLMVLFNDASYYVIAGGYAWLVVRRFSKVHGGINPDIDKRWYRALEGLTILVWACVSLPVTIFDVVCLFQLPDIPDWEPTGVSTLGVAMTFGLNAYVLIVDTAVGVTMYSCMKKAIRELTATMNVKEGDSYAVSSVLSPDGPPSTNIRSIEAALVPKPQSVRSQQRRLRLLRATEVGVCWMTAISFAGALCAIVANLFLYDPDNPYYLPYGVLVSLAWSTPIWHAVFAFSYIKAVKDLMKQIQRA